MKVGRPGPLSSHLMLTDDLLLFAEASVPQMNLICNILDRICTTAGQKVSSFTAAPTMGKYLGIPIIHGRVRRDHFQQVLKFPKGVCQEIDRLCGNFIWGNISDRRRIHLIDWNTLTQPREHEGLGFRHLESFNDALLAKIGCGLLTRLHVLWVHVLRSKYRNRDLSGKAIARAWNSVSEGFAWLLGCGHRVRFWSDPWVPGCAALSAVSLQDLEAEHSEQLIADCVDGSGHWKWAEFGHFIDHSTALKIAAIKPPRPDDPPDHLYWSRISSEIETSPHVLRDCGLTRQTGLLLVPKEYLCPFFSLTLSAGPVFNLSKSGSGKSLNAGRTFLQSDVGFYGHGGTRRSSTRATPDLPMKALSSSKQPPLSVVHSKASFESPALWEGEAGLGGPATLDWVKLNTDGASKGNPGPAGAGGVLRNDDGRWLSGFSHRIGWAIAVIAELWGVLIGLRHVWELVYRSEVLELDSGVAYKMITGLTSSTLHNLAATIHINPWNSYHAGIHKKINALLYFRM
ncbi:hypothetical protein CRG98_040626 [Punica granatum]|uniref:RNase H type-1 domain-containing protein n=1 Tax=Punica granatum TaxID=22663 RepID=A0A2I0I4R2_PUNGR|nr:hypothetical protein CRG98_040626 [Punica granatum]